MTTFQYNECITLHNGKEAFITCMVIMCLYKQGLERESAFPPPNLQ